MEPVFIRQGANPANNNADHLLQGRVPRRAFGHNDYGDYVYLQAQPFNTALQNLQILLDSLTRTPERGSGDAPRRRRHLISASLDSLSSDSSASSDNQAPEVEAGAQPERRAGTLPVSAFGQVLVALMNERAEEGARALYNPLLISEPTEEPEPVEEADEPTGDDVSANQENSGDQDEIISESNGADGAQEERFDMPPNQSFSTVELGSFSQSLYDRCPVHLFNIVQEPSTTGPTTATSTTTATMTATGLESHRKRTTKRNTNCFSSFFSKIFSKKSRPKPAQHQSRSGSRFGAWFCRNFKKTNRNK